MTNGWKYNAYQLKKVLDKIKSYSLGNWLERYLAINFTNLRLSIDCMRSKKLTTPYNRRRSAIMATESIEVRVRTVVEEICRDNGGLDPKGAFSDAAYDPLGQRHHGNSTSRAPLSAAVRVLLEWLQQLPEYEGEVYLLRPRKKILYRREAMKK